MKIQTLLDQTDYISFRGDSRTEITSLVYDSRRVTPGALYVCIRGQYADGHDYIRQAEEAGAAAILAQTRPSFPLKAALILVEDSRTALAQLSQAWFHHPATQMTLIGITGTKGKTTTAHMIKKILERAGHKTGMIGTVGAFIGEEKLPVKNTTPESYELHWLFAQMLAAECKYVVMEVSSQGLKQQRTCGLLFDCAAFLNISPDHIGKGEHANFREYLDCKKMLFSQTRHTVANIDDPHWQEVTQSSGHFSAVSANLTTVSTHREADFYATDIHNIWEPGLLGAAFRLRSRGNPEEDTDIVLNMPGSFNVENALTAIAVTSRLGMEMAQIREALKETWVKGRTQLLQETSHFSTFLIDYAHNALSMECLLQTLRGYHPGRLICLFGGGGNRPRQRRFDMGRIAGQYADLTVITMDNPRYEDMEQINQDIITGLKESHGIYRVIPDRADAIRFLLDTCGREDIVALIGKGHEEYQEIQGKKYYFSEEETVSSYLMTK